MNKNSLIRILIVDDHFIVRVGLAGTINIEPDMVVVAEAEDGLQAVSMFREHCPDITLMDLRLPKMDGVEATINIRKDFQNARIIVLSTYGGDEDIHRALQAGASSYLLKDTLHRDLLKAIRAVHTGRRHIPPEVEARLSARMPGSSLTTREMQVLELMAKGLSNKDIAKALSVTEAAIKFHVLNILNKLGVNDRTLAVTTALTRGIIHLA